VTNLKTLQILIILLGAFACFAQYPSTYKGAPYSGAPTNSQPQTIPGRVYMGYYDMGGEGVAYHDNDSVNNGVPWGNFRPTEGVDVEWTKEDDYWADSAGNKLVPQGVYLIGWTGVGEWVNFTVNVQTAGRYIVGGMVSKDVDRIVRNFVLDNRDTIGGFDVAATGYWHLWRYDSNMVSIPLPAGKHLLKIYELGEGNMQYFDFSLQGSGVQAAPEKGSGHRLLSVSVANNRAQVSFDMPQPGKVCARVYDAAGRCRSSMTEEGAPAGRNVLTIETNGFREGLYILELEHGSAVYTALMRIVR
jgi:hypothetical protein